MVAFNYKPVVSRLEAVFSEAVEDQADLKVTEVRKAAILIASTLFSDMAAAMGGETPSEISIPWDKLSDKWQDTKSNRFRKQDDLAKRQGKKSPSPTARGGTNNFYRGVSSKSNSLQSWLGKRSVSRSFGAPTVKRTRTRQRQHRLEVDLFPKVRDLNSNDAALAALKSSARGGAQKQVKKLADNSGEVGRIGQSRPFLQPFMVHRVKVKLRQKIEALL
jgi:hypothetical protein